METIWLQRPTSDIPWGFRLQGGRDYGAPLSVQKVNPGSVAAGNLTPGDVVLKIGNVNATNITHTDAQEIIKGACNILQFTIKKSPVPAALSPTSYNVNQQPSYQQQQQQQPSYDEYDRYQSLPNYKVGDQYSGPSDRNVSAGYNYAQEKRPYDMRPQEPPKVSGYTTLPVRGSNKENTESFRPVQQQNKYPYKATAGIKLQTNPQTQRSTHEDYDQSGYNYGQMSPVSYQNEYNRQTSGGSQRSGSDNYPQSHFRKPTPFKPGAYDTQNGSVTPPPRLQRQTSSSSQGSSNVYESTITPGYQPPGSFRTEPDPDEAPPMPPPPTNYQRQGSGSYGQSPYQQDYQPQPSYQRQTSQGRSPYDDRQNVPQSGYQQPGMYVDTSDRSAPTYGRQGTQAYTSDYPDYRQGQPQQDPDYYGRGSQSQSTPQRQQSYGSQQPQQPYDGQYTSTPYDRQPSQPQQPAPYGRQPSREQQPQLTPYGRQPSIEQQPQSTPYGRQPSREQQEPPQSTPYGRQPSRDQNQYPQPYQSPQSGGINSFDDILSPFENFQNSNYCDKLFNRSPDNRHEGDSGIQSDLSEPAYSYQSPGLSSDTPRSNLSYTGYSPPQRDYGSSQQGLLRPAPQAPPPPAVSPPPPPPPPLPPTEWAPPKQTSQRPGLEQEQNGSGQMPDKVLNTMMKHGGTQKPFSYVPTGMDLKKFKEKARQRNQPRNVMPKAYAGPAVDRDDEPTQPGAPPNPQTGVYKHSQYNSPLRMYSDDNAKEALNLQAGDNVEVAGVTGTPEKSQSDFKDSEVYRMCKAADKQGNKAKKPRDPLLRHNSIDDEMRFTGLHSKADIPSKAFQRLNQLSINDDGQEVPAGKEQNEPSEEPSRIGNYDEASIRYRGNYIPSPSFRLLQALSKDEANPKQNSKLESPVRRAIEDDSENDGLPDHLDDADLVDPRFKGSYIPSKAFRCLQRHIKDDEQQQQQQNSAPAETKVEEKSGPKINVISRGATDSPKTVPHKSLVPKEEPSTDF